MFDPAAVEASNFWKASSQLIVERRKEVPDPEATADALSELEAIALHTSNPSLRARCHSLLNGAPADCRALSAP